MGKYGTGPLNLLEAVGLVGEVQVSGGEKDKTQQVLASLYLVIRHVRTGTRLAAATKSSERPSWPGRPPLRLVLSWKDSGEQPQE